VSNEPSANPTQRPVTVPTVEVAANDVESKNELEPEIEDYKMDLVAVTNAGEPSTPVTGLPRYADFPKTKVEIRERKSAGRGIYVRSGAKITQGQS